MPEWFVNRPEQSPDDFFYLRAFSELSTCRPVTGFGVSFIPWDKIYQYAKVYGVYDEMIGPFTVIIREMDLAFMKWKEAEAKRSADASKRQMPKPSKSKSRR